MSASLGDGLPPVADTIVVGAGLVGLATAVELLQLRPGGNVLLLEKEDAPATHQSGRNSCVLHSGVYYVPGSAKARLCQDGRQLLLRFCEEEAVPYELCGKVIVATDETERERLSELSRRAQANGVSSRILTSAELRELEPHCAGVAALQVPEAGLVDFRLVARALRRRFEELGGRLVLGCSVERLVAGSRGVDVRTSLGTARASFVLTCAGLYGDRLLDHAPDSTLVPFRGSYYALRPRARHLCRNLIYPVPDPRLPFLGVHVSRRPDGSIWVGPNAALTLHREGYQRLRFRFDDARETVASEAFRRLACRYWRVGVDELFRDFVKPALVRRVRRYLPELRAADLVRADSGVRAQAVARDGTLVDDFVFAEEEHALHVVNAPSPAATSSLAIAQVVARRSLALRGVEPACRRIRSLA